MFVETKGALVQLCNLHYMTGGRTPYARNISHQFDQTRQEFIMIACDRTLDQYAAARHDYKWR
jgi:hypothetical protein